MILTFDNYGRSFSTIGIVDFPCVNKLPFLSGKDGYGRND